MSGALWALAGALAAAAVLCCVFLRCRRRQHQRLLALTLYLTAAARGRESALARTEDEFSLLEDEIYKTVSELRVAREQAQSERRQQADNLADIAHQLKTPLTSMSLLTQLLAEKAAPEQREYITRLESQLTRLGWLTGSLLTMSRFDAGAVEFVPLTLPFEELAARATEPLEQLLLEREQAVIVLGLAVPVCCDPHWTAEALGNIIKNCSEHTPTGGQITLTAAPCPLYLQLTAEDTGPGFDPDELPHLFRRFFRGKHSAAGSVGIGLALSRAIVEGQGGIIRAENRERGGARFIIRLYPRG